MFSGNQMRKLVYYTLGYNEKYFDVMYLSIKSLIYHNKDIDIFVLLDESIMNRANELESIPNLKVFSCDNSSGPQEASMRKLTIFDYNIEEYDSVLCIDADILINSNLNNLFEKISTTDKLCAYAESKDTNLHNYIYWSLNNYTPQNLEYFKNNNIYGFNAGLFGFKPTYIMKLHFSNICGLIKAHTGPFFYEQSFMNYYFNLSNNVNLDIITEDIYQLFPKINVDYGSKIVHFTGAATTPEDKKNQLQNYINMFLTHLIN